MGLDLPWNITFPMYIAAVFLQRSTHHLFMHLYVFAYQYHHLIITISLSCKFWLTLTNARQLELSNHAGNAHIFNADKNFCCRTSLAAVTNIKSCLAMLTTGLKSREDVFPYPHLDVICKFRHCHAFVWKCILLVVTLAILIAFFFTSWHIAQYTVDSHYSWYSCSINN